MLSVPSVSESGPASSGARGVTGGTGRCASQIDLGIRGDAAKFFMGGKSASFRADAFFFFLLLPWINAREKLSVNLR